ncbi:serine/threonine-protein kinase haspin homolog [Drosophila elegans]|uniref:serine/threonine-protein kinase haspin homolog n=1 Tax=Drosophila elegans TaxID=30023 RepID=UPI0007E6A202|nr:serine/threonine-protein kinase haspin homolog [Drosophila elegans]
MDNTLDENGWKDSFDKLLDSRSLLPNTEGRKKTVSASFNMDSSVENSTHEIIESNHLKNKHLNIEDGSRSKSISTPCDKRLGKEIFNCGLSPITRIKLSGFRNENCDDEELRLMKRVRIDHINKATPDAHISTNNLNTIVEALQPAIVLKPGKWRKSLNTFSQSRKSLLCQGRKSVFLKPQNQIDNNFEQEVLKYCNQCKALPFNDAYAESKMLKTNKIGEGAYGEVFRYTPKQLKSDKKNTDLVLKIIPIEGSMQINGEEQKTFAQILPEIIITQKMSSLEAGKNNCTDGFAGLYKVSLVKGKYPQHLTKLWERYDDEKESENDHPGVFGDTQLFVVLELKFAGNDMSNFEFLNAEQSYYALQQIILSLAVGEEQYQFEHRDLHWGNILIGATKKKHISFKLKNTDFTILSKGVAITIIDYTLSRITIDDCCYFNDLSTDEELFSATGDYQYDIYRMMRSELKNNWSSYSPKTNIQWLSYLNAKLLDGVKYKSANTKVHRLHIDKLKELQSIMLTFESAAHCAKHLFNMC